VAILVHTQLSKGTIVAEHSAALSQLSAVPEGYVPEAPIPVNRIHSPSIPFSPRPNPYRRNYLMCGLDDDVLAVFIYKLLRDLR
jgi:hypothetical protein